jgi:hypothetical protein
MNSIDLVYLAQPLAIVAATSLLLVRYYRARLLSVDVIEFSALAYFLAIVGKVFFQLAVAPPASLAGQGLYYGLQTVFLEVGLAYVFVRYAVEHGLIRVDQAPAYGAGLAFWENGVLLGLLALPGLVAEISAGGSGLPSGSVVHVVAWVALGTLERVSSVLLHFSWGILVVVAAASNRVKFLLAALPMGLVDFLVPFAPSLPLWEFETAVFALALAGLTVTYLLTREEWPDFWRPFPVRPVATTLDAR